jgi:hypothetical protein
MIATAKRDCGDRARCLYLAFELGWREWKLTSASQRCEAARLRTLKR